jgi:trimethylamine:corrinoid methyltransferase-like protein
MEVNPQTLSFDMIKKVGHRNAYIGEKESAKAYRTMWRQESILFEDGSAEGRKWRDPVDVARETVEWIIENHQPETLPADVKAEIRNIVSKADQDEELAKAVRGH